MYLSSQFSSDIVVERNLRKVTEKSAFRCTSEVHKKAEDLMCNLFMRMV